VLAGFNCHAALVSQHDLLHDIQPQSQTLIAALALRAAEWIKQLRQQIGRNRPRAGHGEGHLRRMAAIGGNLHRLTHFAVLQGIAHEVGCDLREPLGVPLTGKIALL